MLSPFQEYEVISSTKNNTMKKNTVQRDSHICWTEYYWCFQLCLLVCCREHSSFHILLWRAHDYRRTVPFGRQPISIPLLSK